MESQETTTSSAPPQGPVLDEGRLYQYKEKLRLEQNLPLGLVAGLIAALSGAVIWAVITVSTGYQIGYMAIGVGFIVGYAIRYSGKGLDKIFGIMGAALALLGCLMGNFFSFIAFASQIEGVGYLEAIEMVDYAYLPEVMFESFSPIDLLFYGLAIYEGYRFSFRVITEQEILANATK